jgi:UDP-N-acetylmuramate dehydrogenase
VGVGPTHPARRCVRVQRGPVQVLPNVALAPLTTLRIGGPAARMAELTSEGDVLDAVHQAGAAGLLVLGGGSNLVIGDDGFPGLVARMAIRGTAVRRDGDAVVVDVGAGEEWDALVARAVEEDWSGVASLSGIPGRVGATPIQNVGAYGEEVADTIAGVRVFDRASGAIREMSPGECGFGYRASVFKRSDRWIVTRVRFVFERHAGARVRYPELARTLSVEEGAEVPAARVREAVIALRRGKGMVLDPADPDSVSAGSFFVNPVVDRATAAHVESIAGSRPPRFDAPDGRVKLAAGWLVERAGFVKGWGTGRAGVSRKHALALVNRGGASSRELLEVARAIRDGVRARFGVTLEPEPVLVGCSLE